MLFKYKAVDNQNNQQKDGTIEAINVDVAIASLQRRNLFVQEIKAEGESGAIMHFLQKLSIFERVSTKEIVILSRQMATLFQAQVSALRIFKMLAAASENAALAGIMEKISEDLQGGASISSSIAKHPKAFSPFYVNMVRAGEESGKLDETFAYLADYLDRNYEVTSKARGALVYPAFVIFTFFTVMILMLTFVIPKVSAILTESGQDIPIYTKIVLGLSNFLNDYGFFLFVLLVIGIGALWKFATTEAGKLWFSRLKISIPYLKNLYSKLYLARISDNMNTMLISGISMVRALELTADVVGNEVYRRIVIDSLESVKSGNSVSDSLGKYKEVPTMMIQMMKVGEETGELGSILKTLAKFYNRDVITAVDALVDLIEPVMIIVLGLGVIFLLMSVLMPIYNMSAAF